MITNKKITLGILILIFVAVTLLVSNNNPFIIGLDNSVYDWIANHQSPSFYNFMRTITNVGDVLSTVIILLVFSAFLFFKNKKDSYVLALAAFSSIILTETIKHVVQRARPENLLQQGFSFPSAHAMISAVFLLASIYLLSPLLKNKFSKYTFLLITSVVFPLVAFSRIYLSVHYTSDVIAGILLGSICFLFSWLAYCYKKENVL